MNKLNDIVLQFDLAGQIDSIKPLGNGLINDTYKVETAGGPSYVLQRVNHNIFKDVDLLQNNIVSVTSHIRRKLEAEGAADVDRKVLTFVPLKDSAKTYYFDGESYWRVSLFIEDAYTYETVNPEYSYYAGRSFGQFEAMLADIPDTLGETIPDFHNMELRARQLNEAVAADAVGRMAEEEVQDILKRDILFLFVFKDQLVQLGRNGNGCNAELIRHPTVFANMQYAFLIGHSASEQLLVQLSKKDRCQRFSDVIHHVATSAEMIGDLHNIVDLHGLKS